MPTNIYTLIEQQRAQLLAADDAYLASLTRGWQVVEDALQERIEALAQYTAQQAANDQTVSENTLYRETRYVALLAQTRAVIMEYAGETAVSLEQQQQTFGQAGTADAQAVLQEAGVRSSFNLLPKGATNVAIGLAGNGSPLRTLLEASWPDAMQSMTNTLIRNTALGVNPRKTAREMQQATGASLSRMLVLSRTEMLRAYRESTRATYKENGISQMQRLCAKNSRSCYLCISRDGEIISTDQPLAIHPCCRCVAIAANIPGYTLPPRETGAEWFAKQSPAQQRATLGKGRYELYKSGEVALSNFSTVVNDPTWGPTIKVVPLSLLAPS